MFKLNPEAKVGMFVLLGVIILVYMSLRVGGMQFGRGEGYDVSVKMPSAAGLDNDASVRIAGVEVGRVKDIVLEDNKAKVILRLYPGVKIGTDFVAVLKTKGLLGERFLELIPGSPNAPLVEHGGEITRVTTYTDMDRLINQLSEIATDIKSVSTSVSGVLGGSEGEAVLRRIVTNVEELTTNLNAVVASNDQKFTRMLTNFEDFSKLLKDRSPEIADGMKSISDNLNQVIAENRSNLKDGIGNLKAASVKLEETMETMNKLAKNVEPKIDDTVTSIGNVAKKIDKGEGTLGKLINDPSTHDNINDAKSYLSLRIQPKADKYYLIEVVDDPQGRRKTKTTETTTGGTTTIKKEIETEDSIKFSAQIAKRFHDVTVRGGLIESTGGFGADYHLLNDKLKFTFEAFDFDKKRNPRLKAAATYSIGKYFFVTGGYDDFISRVGNESLFIGAGFHFEDEDIKYLLTSAPIPTK
ncbi:MAG: MCE family protein [Deltaproteobacteria bacterium]|nr:MCE family protein [Deltaproteobacteria bacterium]